MILAQCNTVENHQDFKSILSRRVIKLAQNNSKTNDSLLLKDRRHEMFLHHKAIFLYGLNTIQINFALYRRPISFRITIIVRKK